MIYILLLGLITLIIIALLFFIPIYIKVNFSYQNSSKYEVVISWFYGAIKKVIRSDDKVIKIKEGKSLSKIDIIDFIQYIIDKGNINNLSLRTNIGIMDPAILSITTGWIWALVNMTLLYFLRNKDTERINKIDLQVIPFFNKEIFELYFSCIIRLNLVYAIIIYWKNFKKSEGGDIYAKSSNRRINANYND